MASKVCFGFPADFGRAAGKAVVTGNPVRKEILDLPAPAQRFAGREGPLRVLVVGGSARGRADHALHPVFASELFDPVSRSWRTLAHMRVPRLYHSTALLLPDGRVLAAGKDSLYNPAPYNYPERRVEIFSPPYLFRGARPRVTAAPAQLAEDQRRVVFDVFEEQDTK